MNSAVVSLKVRCAAVFALGTFVGNSAERTDHSTTIDHNVAMMLAQLINDGSPVVRKVSWLLNVGIGQRDFQSFSLDLILIQQQKKWDGVSFWLKSICKTSPSFSYKHFFFYRTMIDERIKKVKCFALADTSLEGLPFFNDVSDLWL